MKIVNAVWEQRNLGVTTTEIMIEDNDTPDLVEEQLSVIDSGYSVVKVPSEMGHILKLVQANGYTFIEDMIHVEHDLHEIKMNSILKRLYEKTSYREMNDADFDITMICGGLI